MSSVEETLQLELRDIIKITAPINDKLDGNTFLITYIDTKQIEIKNVSSLKEFTLILDEEGEIVDESVESISLLSRDTKRGYARQQGLLPKIWVTVTIGGDMPSILSGEITNLDEDQIEISTYPDRHVIYIDFGYKGIPKNIPIKSIEIRDAPIMEIIAAPILDSTQPAAPIPAAPIPDIKAELSNIIVLADEISFGDDLGEITQDILVDDLHERYGIQTQTNDLLDELLSTIPNSKRTSHVLNNIHLMIERFKELRTIFSHTDDYNNPTTPLKKGKNFKPLIESLKQLNTSLNWIIPVVKNKKKVYNVDEAEADEADDIVLIDSEYAQYNDDLDTYSNNSIPDNENKYDYLLNVIQENGLSIEHPDEPDSDFITIQNVKSNINVLVDNLDEFYSTVVANESLVRKQYQMDRYNLGFSKLETIVEQGSKPYNKSVQATPSNKAYIKSLMLLSDTAIRQTRASLPGSTIMTKASINNNGFYHYSQFNNVTTDIIESFDSQPTINFINSSTEYILDDSLQGEDNKYEKYLDYIIPNTSTLFNTMKKYIVDKLTVGDIVNELESFLVYNDNITSTEYNDIVSFLHSKIDEHVKTYKSKKDAFFALQTGDKIAPSTTHSLFEILKREDIQVLEEMYGLTKLGNTSSEHYHNVLQQDSGQLLMTTLALENLELITPIDINTFFNNNVLAINSSEKKASKCPSYTLTKRYLKLETLLDDNGKDIYIDNDLDQTHYDIIGKYDIDRAKMSPDEFEAFLKNKLIENIGLSDEDAQKDAHAMIIGKRKIEEGQYASLDIDNGEKVYYYKRTNNEWIRDESLPSVKMNDALFCNIQPTCIKDKKVCEPIDESVLNMEKRSYKTLMNEFNIKYEVSVSDMTRMIENRFAYLKQQIRYIKQKKVDKRYKYNDEHVKLGSTNSDDRDIVIVSPYAKLRDSIFGQQDIIKRNNDIIKFYNAFLRDASDNDDKNWFYCKETNVKLLPVFIYTLASTFVTNKYDYVKVMDTICKQQGKISDDGNAWVDEHSGYIIKPIEFSSEEGYDESGFKSSSREAIRTVLNEVRSEEFIKKFSDPNAEKISNVINAITGFMGFNGELMHDFVIRNTLNNLSNSIVKSKELYDKKVASAAKLGKKLPEYIDAYHTAMMIALLSYLTIAIQTSMPSVKAKKQFPGCIRSFTGFPLDENGDNKSIDYLACVVNKIKSKVSPWNVLQKMKQPGIVKRIKEFIIKNIMIDREMKRLLKDKRQFLLENDEEDIPDELDIARWHTFLPPLIPIKTEHVDEFTQEFKDTLMSNIRSGNPAQQYQLQLVKGMLTHYPMVMIEKIHSIVHNEKPVLTNVSNDAFLENACCIDDKMETTNEYFMNREASLRKYNSRVKEIRLIYESIISLSVAPRIYSAINTKRIYPKLSLSYSKNTIYRAFIYFCNFGTHIPVPTNLNMVCISKPSTFSIFDTLSDQIKDLETNGRDYTYENLQQLMQIINKANIIQLPAPPLRISGLDKLLQYISDEPYILPNELRLHISDLIGQFSPQVAKPTPSMNNLINYLDDEITSMKTNLLTFLSKNSKLTVKKFDAITNNIINDVQWKDIDGNVDRSSLRSTNYMANNIYELTQVFPNMIINGISYTNVKLPKHWKNGLSERHSNDLRNIIAHYYLPLSRYNNNETLTPILSQISGRTAVWRDFIKMLPVFERIGKETNASSFNTNILNMLLEYCILQCYNVFIEVADEDNTVGIVSESFVTIATEEMGNISEIDIVNGEKHQRNSIVSSFLLDIISMFGKTKQLLNYSYTDIIYRVNVSKEKEKDQFTKRLKDLSDEERNIENTLKNHKLGLWSKGLSKGVTQYDKDTYDDERESMERVIAFEQQIDKQDFVSDMNRDIYLAEAEEEDRVGKEIEDAELRITYEGEDGDDEHEGLDGDEYF